MSPDEFNERYAHYLVSGQGETRQHVAALMSEVHNVINRYVAAKTGKQPKLATVDDFIPEVLKPAKRDKEKAGLGKRLAKAFGFK